MMLFPIQHQHESIGIPQKIETNMIPGWYRGFFLQILQVSNFSFGGLLLNTIETIDFGQ
jgi:hypothetical protein